MSIISEIKIKYFVEVALLLLFLLVPIFSFAEDVDISNPFDTTDVQTIITNVLSAIFGIAGTIATAMIVYAGILYTTSGGDQKKLDAAKNTLTYAIVGLLVIGLSYAIVNFIIGAINGS